MARITLSAERRKSPKDDVRALDIPLEVGARSNRGAYRYQFPRIPGGFGSTGGDPSKKALAFCAGMSCWRWHDRVWTKKDGVVLGDEWWSFEFTRETFEYMVTRLRKRLGKPTTSARVFGRRR